MNIVEDATFKKTIIEAIALREFRERIGVHCSDLIYCLNKTAFRKWKPLPTDEQEVLIYSLGWATQRWLSGKLVDAPEQEVDGIIVTADVILDIGAPWELKATFQASTKSIEENVHWIRQMMAQCYVNKSLVAYLTRFEIMGNWKWVYHPSKPETIQKLVEEFGENWADHPTLHAYRLDFTQDELNQNWEWLKARRVQLLNILESMTLLPRVAALASGQTWECEFCRYRDSDCIKEEISGN